MTVEVNIHHILTWWRLASNIWVGAVGLCNPKDFQLYRVKATHSRFSSVENLFFPLDQEIGEARKLWKHIHMIISAVGLFFIADATLQEIRISGVSPERSWLLLQINASLFGRDLFYKEFYLYNMKPFSDKNKFYTAQNYSYFKLMVSPKWVYVYRLTRILSCVQRPFSKTS